jgi:hypothetical protein
VQNELGTLAVFQNAKCAARKVTPVKASIQLYEVGWDTGYKLKGDVRGEG